MQIKPVIFQLEQLRHNIRIECASQSGETCAQTMIPTVADVDLPKLFSELVWRDSPRSKAPIFPFKLNKIFMKCDMAIYNLFQTHAVTFDIE